jgi:SAM-dependent methyltransferase
MIKNRIVCRRERIRRREFDLITCTIRDILSEEKIGKLRILEFGCGVASGVQNLSKLGTLIVTDIYRDPSLELPIGVQFKIEDIHRTDFIDNEFDVIISNSVLQYLDFERAFKELKRIGKQNALYVFSVPTTIWLVLAIPAKIFKKCENIFLRLKTQNKTSVYNSSSINITKKNKKKNWISKFTLGGHGRYKHFYEALVALRVKNWRRLLLSYGFNIVKEAPLLTYSDSELPIIPPSRTIAKLGISSSYLFVCSNVDDKR